MLVRQLDLVVPVISLLTVGAFAPSGDKRVQIQRPILLMYRDGKIFFNAVGAVFDYSPLVAVS